MKRTEAFVPGTTNSAINRRYGTFNASIIVSKGSLTAPFSAE
ncbi:hypothetical protein [Haladaptatus sp. DYF46]|nr:hypothetical protein [Haladaptatus sp. DYF46]